MVWRGARAVAAERNIDGEVEVSRQFRGRYFAFAPSTLLLAFVSFPDEAGIARRQMWASVVE